MNEIIKLEERKGCDTVNAKELYEFLGVGRDFSSWMKQRINKYGFIKNEDYTTDYTTPQNGGMVRTEYYLTLDMSKELSMVENSEKGKQARKYFIEVEKRARVISFPKLPQSYSEALRELALTVEENEQLKINELQNAPKVELAETCLRNDTEMSITDAGKHLKISQSAIFKIMRDNEYLTQKRRPTQKALDRKILSLKSNPSNEVNWAQTVMNMDNIMNFQKRHLKPIPVQGNLLEVING